MNVEVPSQAISQKINSVDAEILAAASKCVMCGLCNSHCPTYLDSRLEYDSPRGRISLAQAILTDSIPHTQQAWDALDNCLGCRKCEVVCPSKVSYHRIWTHALSKRPVRNYLSNKVANLISRTHGGKRWINTGLRIYQKSGLRWFARQSGIVDAVGLKHADQALGEIQKSARLHSYYPAHMNERGKVALFKGCLANTADIPVVQAGVRVLNRLGYGVHIPESQTCCGAIYLHAGDSDNYLRNKTRNIDVFVGQVPAKIPIVGFNTGCLITLKEYNDVSGIGAQVTDILTFLNNLPHWNTYAISPLRKRVVIHTPCTGREGLGDESAVQQFLHKIPGLEALNPQKNYACCGAAGIRMLKPSELQIKLRNKSLDSLTAQNPDIIVSNNVSCSMHLGNGLRIQKNPLEIIHPLILMDRQLA